MTTTEKFIKSFKRVPGAASPVKAVWNQYRELNPDATRAEFLADLGRHGYRIETIFGRQHVADLLFARAARLN